MRYSAEHKQQTRERIVQEASRQFRHRGAKGLAIPELMKKLKLTHGGFYKHFESKQQLLAEAIAKGFEETEAGFSATIKKAKAGSELKAFITYYLSVGHCMNPAGGCPMAPLVSEIARYPRPIRLEVERASQRRIKQMAKLLPGKTAKEREQNSLVLMSGMMGALNLARATVDPESRRTILDTARDFYVNAFCK